MAEVIPVAPSPEPADFDAKVRQKGIADLKSRGLPLTGPVPPKTELKRYWSSCMDQLYDAYHGKCAYLGMHFEKVLGAGSADHFVAKSSDVAMAYEWANYRLACLRMNSRKGDYDDVLDPFYLAPGLFHLELTSGQIYANPRLAVQTISIVRMTIERLGLDDPMCRESRTSYFQDYVKGEISADYLKSKYPFVWVEASRQGFL